MLRELRETAGVSREEMARRVGLDRSTVSRTEAVTANPTLATIRRYFDALGYDLEIRAIKRDLSLVSEHEPHSLTFRKEDTP